METSAVSRALQYKEKFASLERLLWEFKNVTCNFVPRSAKESAMEFARRVYKNSRLLWALDKTTKSKIKIILNGKFDVIEETIFIDIDATDDEIITFLLGDTIDRQAS